MLIAVCINASMSTNRKSDFRILFWVTFHKLYAIAGNISKERNKVRFLHGMMYRYMIVVFYLRHNQRMCIIHCILYSQFWKCNATAAEHTFSHRIDDIATNRADIKSNFFQITAAILVYNIRTSKQLGN